MTNWAGDILDVFETTFDNKNLKGLKICTVKSVEPFIFTYNEIDLGATFGDKVYVHPLFLNPSIELDKDDLALSQTFASSTAYNSPQFQAAIEGSVPDFISDFYEFYENWCSVFRLQEGDLIAVYELEDGGFLILQKVKKDVVKEEGGQDEF